MNLPLFFREAALLAQNSSLGGLGLYAAQKAQVAVEAVLRLSLILGMVDWCERHVHQLLDLKGLDLDL